VHVLAICAMMKESINIIEMKKLYNKSLVSVPLKYEKTEKAI
jgi:hypothetical protein